MEKLKEIFKDKKMIISACLIIAILVLLIIVIFSLSNEKNDEKISTPSTTTSTTNNVDEESDEEIINNNSSTTNNVDEDNNEETNSSSSTTKKKTTTKKETNTTSKTTQKTTGTTSSDNGNSYPFDTYIAKFYVNDKEYASYDLTPGKTIPKPSNPTSTNGLCFKGWKLWGTNGEYNFNNKVDENTSTYNFDAIFSQCEDTEKPYGYATISVKDGNGNTLKTFSSSSDYVNSGVSYIYNYNIDFSQLSINISGGKDNVGVSAYDTYSLTGADWHIVSSAKSLKVSSYLEKENACYHGFNIYLKDNAGNKSTTYTNIRFCEN